MVPGYLSDETHIPDMTRGKCGCNFGKCGASIKHQCPVEHKTFSYIAPGETGDDYLYEELHVHPLPIVGHVVIPTGLKKLLRQKQYFSNHTNGKLWEVLKSGALLNLVNAYKIIRG